MNMIPDKRTLLRYAQEAGGFSIIRFLTRHLPKAIMYHRFSARPEHGKVSADEFYRQMQELRSGFNVLSMSDACDRLINDGALPRHTVVITIDDGYRDFYEIAYPVLQQFNLPATLYITTDFIDNKIWLWPDIISYVIDRTDRSAIHIDSRSTGSHELPLRTESEKSRSWDRIIGLCTSVDNLERMNIIDQVLESAGIRLPEQPSTEYAPLTWAQISEMADNDIEIGAHTLSHPVLSRLSMNELDREIAGCKRRIEEQINRSVYSFCYPNGQPADIDRRVKEAVARAGYTNACAAYYDHRGWEDLYEIRRFSGGSNFFRFRKIINGSQLLGAKLNRRHHVLNQHR